MSGHMFRAACSRFAWPVLIVGLVVCACASSSAKATLHIDGNSGAAGYFQDRVAVRRPITVQTFSVCTDGAPVRVSAVRLDDPLSTTGESEPLGDV